MISENLTGTRTHFIGNRTVPCEPPQCEPCQNGVAWRWHAYLLVLVESTQEIVIFETTSIASRSFANYFERHGTLRGCLFQAERVSSKANGRVLIQCRPADLARVTLPPVQSVERLLCHIWNIAPNQVEVPSAMTRPPAREIHVDRARPELKDAAAGDQAQRIIFPIPTAASPNGEKP